MALRGRPKRDDAKRNILPFRMNEQESLELSYVAESLGMTKSEVIRQLVNSKYRMLKWYDKQ